MDETTVEDFSNEQLINELLRRGNRNDISLSKDWVGDRLVLFIDGLSPDQIVTDETHAEDQY